MSNISFTGVFVLRCWNEDGSLAWEAEAHNAPTNVGLNYVGAASFTGGAQFSLWYVGLINNAGFTSLNPADTMSSHSGWSEFTSFTGAGADLVTALEGDILTTMTGVAVAGLVVAVVVRFIKKLRGVI